MPTLGIGCGHGRKIPDFQIGHGETDCQQGSREVEKIILKGKSYHREDKLEKCDIK